MTASGGRLRQVWGTPSRGCAACGRLASACRSRFSLPAAEPLSGCLSRPGFDGSADRARAQRSEALARSACAGGAALCCLPALSAVVAISLGWAGLGRCIVSALCVFRPVVDPCGGLSVTPCRLMPDGGCKDASAAFLTALFLPALHSVPGISQIAGVSPSPWRALRPGAMGWRSVLPCSPRLCARP